MSDTNPGQGAAAQTAGAARVVESGQGWNWITQAWALFMKRPGIWIAIGALLCVVAIAGSKSPKIIAVAIQIAFPVIVGGLMHGCMALDRGESLKIGHFIAGFKANTAQLVLLGVFSAVAGLLIEGFFWIVVALAGGGAILAGLFAGDVAAILAGGTALLLVLIAALIAVAVYVPVAMAAWFAPALVALRNAQAIDALKQSFFACLANWVPFLIYGLITLGLAICATIPAGLGWLVLGPVLVASIYTGYRDLFPAP